MPPAEPQGRAGSRGPGGEAACEETRGEAAASEAGSAKPEAEKSAADKPAAEKVAADKPAADKPAGEKPAGDKPAAKPKVELLPFEEAVYVQGNDAFDRSSATLKPGGQKEIDELLAMIKKRAVQVNAVIVSGHTDRLEAKSAPKSLSEDRAKTVKDYVVSRGINEKLIFWEGKEATQPVAVTKFCS